MRCAMPIPTLPAASLRPANRLPASRVLLGAPNCLIYKVLWSIWRVIFSVESSFLPALRGMPGGGRDVVKRQCHRDHRVVAHQADDVGDPDMAERLDRAVVEPFCHPARIGK